MHPPPNDPAEDEPGGTESPQSPQVLRIEDDPDGSLRVLGDVDLTTARALSTRLLAAVRPDRPLTVDICGVKLLQSHGVAVLFDIAAATELTLRVAAGSAVASVIRIIGLDSVATIDHVEPDI